MHMKKKFVAMALAVMMLASNVSTVAMALDEIIPSSSASTSASTSVVQEETPATSEPPTNSGSTESGEDSSSVPDSKKPSSESESTSDDSTVTEPADSEPEYSEPPTDGLENETEEQEPAEVVIEPEHEETEIDMTDMGVDDVLLKLYSKMPYAPTGSYIGTYGTPMATGETKISVSGEVDVPLDKVMNGEVLDQNNLTITAEKKSNEKYAIVPIVMQVAYPAYGSSTKLVLPDDVKIMDYNSSENAPEPMLGIKASELISEKHTGSAGGSTSLYLLAEDDFVVEYIYQDVEGNSITKTLTVIVKEKGNTVLTAIQDFAGTIIPLAGGVADTGTITRSKYSNGEGSTYLLWFNGLPAYCIDYGKPGMQNSSMLYSYAGRHSITLNYFYDDYATNEGSHILNTNQVWIAMGQMVEEIDPSSFAMASPAMARAFSRTSAIDNLLEQMYGENQILLIKNYPDSVISKMYVEAAMEMLEDKSVVTTAVQRDVTINAYLYTPADPNWQRIITFTPPPETPDEPGDGSHYAPYTLSPQSASDKFDYKYTVNTDKFGLETKEKVDGAIIEIEPVTKSGTIDGGKWSIKPADKQTVTTSGHTNNDSYQNNGGDGTAKWDLNYSVSKTVGESITGEVGPYLTPEEAIAAAAQFEAETMGAWKAQAQSQVAAAIAKAKSQLNKQTFRYQEVGSNQSNTEAPYGYEYYTGENGSNQRISVTHDSNEHFPMQNDEWSLKVTIDKTDSETGKRISADTEFSIFEWDTVTQQYIPNGGYNQYKVERQADGTYTVINHSDYAITDEQKHTLYYTQRNEGKFIIAERTAPTGYFGDWTDLDEPFKAGSVLGKRAYYIEITRAKDQTIIKLDNAEYNADIATSYTDGTKLLTEEGVTATVTINRDSYYNASRTYNTDNSDTANNEDTYTFKPKTDVFQNDRALGEISLSKVDLDAILYFTEKSHGDAPCMDGAVYDLYAAEDIMHPDGVTGIVDYSKITANGSPIWTTTVRDNAGHWVSDYQPVLKKDHLVASAEIKNGWLTFSNLYLGKYYIVERSTGTVLALESDAFVISGTYPAINAKTKQATGVQNPLVTNADGTYFDWVYKNQFSNIGQSKALNGEKTYDGYYVSFAKGYLCDEHNYYITPTYANESWYVEKTAFEDNRQAEKLDATDYSKNYHIHRSNELAESDDQIMKGNIEISKVVSSTGSSDGKELEHAGFTFFLISDLSKVGQFKQNNTGAYDIKSILDAYANLEYDESSLKYDFTAEGDAIAKSYILDPSMAETYNRSLTAAEDFRNGTGKGWVKITGSDTHDRAARYQLSEIFSNDTGNIRVEGLPYGQYLVVETTTPKDLFQAEPFIVTIDPTDAKNPQSLLAHPKDSVLVASNSFTKYTVLDEEIEVYLRLFKLDQETGKEVLLPDTSFQIYWMDDEGNYRLNDDGSKKLVVMTDVSHGQITKSIDTFYTDENGVLALPEKLPLGHYRIVEIDGPNGFFNEWATDGTFWLDFEVTTNRAYEATGDDNEDSQDTLVIEEQYENNETLGKLTIRKTGEVLTGFDDKFTYAAQPLTGAEYTITANEDIYTQDRQLDANGNRTLWYAKGDVVAVVITGDGTIGTVKYAPSRTNPTYDFLSVIYDGTVGEVSVTLPLGSYHIEESKPPYGYVGTTQSYDVTFEWDSQANDVVMAKTIVSHSDDKASAQQSFDIINADEATAEQLETQVLSYYNEREKAKVGVYKKDIKTEKFVAGAIFELYTSDDIYAMDGTRIFEAGDLVATSPETKADGYTFFDVDVPIRGEKYGDSEATKSSATNSGNYTIVEKQAPLGYFLNETPMSVSFTYDGEALQVLDSTCLNEATSVYVSKRKLTGDDELAGATLTIKDKDGKTVQKWVSGKEPTEICGLHLDEVYTLVETVPAKGYALASNIKFKLVQSEDANGIPIMANDVYVLTGKDWLVFDHWTLMEDGVVVMRDDITRVKISKRDIATNEELPGAHLTITDKNGKVVEEWTSTDKPHYIEKLPAGTYTLTEVTAPSGYDVAESFEFEVKPTGEIQTFIMLDKPTEYIPKTGIESIAPFLIGGAAVALCGVVVIAVVLKKKKATHEGAE